MKVELSKTYPLDASVDQAWQLLKNIESVAGCMPGAAITGQIDENNYEGTISVKLGPVSAKFNGQIELVSVNPDQREIRLIGKGSDSKGSTSASMDLTASVCDTNPNCELIGDAEVTVNGKMANFGGRMMTQVADQVLNQFAENFANAITIQTGSPEQSSATPQAPEAKQLNGLKLLWNVLAGYISGLFGKNKPTAKSG